MIKIIKLLCWLKHPKFRWRETRTHWKSDYADNLKDNYPRFELDFGLTNTLNGGYCSIFVEKHHLYYRLKSYLAILKLVFLK